MCQIGGRIKRRPVRPRGPRGEDIQGLRRREAHQEHPPYWVRPLETDGQAREHHTIIRGTRELRERAGPLPLEKTPLEIPTDREDGGRRDRENHRMHLRTPRHHHIPNTPEMAHVATRRPTPTPTNPTTTPTKQTKNTLRGYLATQRA